MMVQTANGPKLMQDVKIGDQLLSHIDNAVSCHSGGGKLV
jgi:hypothetical protein